MSADIRSEEAKAKAEARFKLVQQRNTDAQMAWSESEERRVAEAEKTSRLRALRLQKEEAESARVVTKPSKKTSAKKSLKASQH